MEIRKYSKTNLSMCIFEFRAFVGICKQMVKTTHDFLIKSTKDLLHFLVPFQNTMNAKLTSNINLAKKLKKPGSRRETALAGVADHLTEEEKTNINLTLSKMDQLSNNIRVEDKPPNRNTTEKPIFEAFFLSFQNDLCAYEESDKIDCLMFSTMEYFQFKTDLYQSFNPLYYQRYITEITIFENQANRVLLFLASDRGFIYSKMREDCLQKNIIWKEYVIGQKLSYTTVNKHIQFHELVLEFPRVLVSNASKTEWFKFMNHFKVTIRDEESMKTRMAASLKEFVEEDSLFDDAVENLKMKSVCLVLFTIYI